jgi:hypothetical protein
MPVTVIAAVPVLLMVSVRVAVDPTDTPPNARLPLSAITRVDPVCVIVSVAPSIVMTPVREPVPVLAVTEYATLPSPFPLVEPVNVIHDTLSVAVHAHPAAVVTVTVPVVAAALTVRVVGFRVVPHVSNVV